MDLFEFIIGLELDDKLGDIKLSVFLFHHLFDDILLFRVYHLTRRFIDSLCSFSFKQILSFLASDANTLEVSVELMLGDL